MGFLSFLSPSSSSSQSTTVHDERVGAEGGAIAVRQVSADNVIFGSDDTAQLAIQSSTNALTASTDFIGAALTSFFNLTDKRLQSADSNIAAQNKMTADLLEKEQESSDDRLVKIFTYAIVAGLGYTALKSGVLKDLKGIFK